MRKPVEFETSFVCNFLELDPFGHLNTLHYVSHFLKHRFDETRDKVGLSVEAIAKLPFIFVTQNLSVDFIRSIYADEKIIVRSRITEVHDNHCFVGCEMTKPNGKLAATCTMKLVCIDKATQKTTSWPDSFVDLMFEKT